MCNLVDEKYHIALFIQAASTFTFQDLHKSLKTQDALDAAYALIGELLEKGFIEISQLIITEDEQVAKLYKIVTDKSTELDRYIIALAQQRLNPDAQGKPQGGHYRKTEALVKQLVSSREALQEHEKEVLLTKLYNSLKWAQDEMLTNWPEDIRQAVLSEAYLRTLYAEYLEAHAGFWAGAILQALIASRMFHEQGLLDQCHLIEQRSCEIFIKRHNVVKQKKHIPDLLDFASTTDKVIGECTSPIFIALARSVLDEISERVDYLSRSTDSGDIANVINKAWTVSVASGGETANPLFKSLNESRLFMLNGNRGQGKKLLEEALTTIESNREENTQEEGSHLETLLKKHLISLELYDLLNTVIRALQENNQDEISRHLSELEKLRFDGLFPFYIADVLERVKSVLNLFRSYAETLSQKGDATSTPSHGSSYPKRERAYEITREKITGSRDDFDYRDLADWRTPTNDYFFSRRPGEGFSLRSNGSKNNVSPQPDYQSTLPTEQKDNQALSPGTYQGIQQSKPKNNPLDLQSPDFSEVLFSFPSLPDPDRALIGPLVSISPSDDNDSQLSIQLRVTRSR